MKIKHKIIKIAISFLLPLIKVYWRVFKPNTFGVKVIIENGGKYLCIRNNYGNRSMTFPGGGIKKGETPEQAAFREVKEEVGLDLSELKFISSLFSVEEGKRDNISIFYGKSTSDNLTKDDLEIMDVKWFTKDHPPVLPPLSKKIWDLFIGTYLE